MQRCINYPLLSFGYDRGGAWKRLVEVIFSFFPDLCVPKYNLYSLIDTDTDTGMDRTEIDLS